MIFKGVLASGGELLLGDPAEVVMSFDRDAPADQLKAVFPAQGLWDELKEVRVYDGGLGVFRGIVDEQNTRLSSEGLSVELICRSMEAVMLDNEAEPRPILNPSLEVLKARLLEPLGFTDMRGDAEAFSGELAIDKGSSCWTVLANFCRGYLGTEPWVDLDGVVHCEGQDTGRLELGRIISAELSDLPVKRLSAVWKQGYRGGYDTLYPDPEATMERRRYISAQSGRNPREVLREARRGSFRLTVTCAGRYWPGDVPLRGALADVAVPRVGRFAGCPVVKAVYYRDRNGERTRFVLERGEDRVAD